MLRLLSSKRFFGRGGVWGKVRVGTLSPKAEHTGPSPVQDVVQLFVDCTNFFAGSELDTGSPEESNETDCNRLRIVSDCWFCY